MKRVASVFLSVAVLASCGKKSDPAAPPSNPSSGTSGTGGSSSSSTTGASSPQEAFEKFKAAGEKKDVGALYDIVSPDDVDMMVFGAMMIGAFSTMGDEAKGKEFDAIAKKYNMPDDKDDKGPKLDMSNPEALKKQLAEKLKDVKDKRGFCVEAFAFSEKHSQPGNGGSFKTDGTIKDLKETGDTATATFVQPDGKEKPLNFKKVQGRWYVGMPGM